MIRNDYNREKHLNFECRFNWKTGCIEFQYKDLEKFINIFQTEFAITYYQSKLRLELGGSNYLSICLTDLFTNYNDEIGSIDIDEDGEETPTSNFIYDVTDADEVRFEEGEDNAMLILDKYFYNIHLMTTFKIDEEEEDLIKVESHLTFRPDIKLLSIEPKRKIKEKIRQLINEKPYAYFIEKNLHHLIKETTLNISIEDKKIGEEKQDYIIKTIKEIIKEKLNERKNDR